MKKIKGYKVFNPDFTCKGFKYEVGKTYTHKGNIELCEAGFHFCKRLIDCFNYYRFNPKNKVAEVEALGKTISDEGKTVTNKIKILKELSWFEVLELLNTGKSNTGLNNSGDWNTGDRNTGDRNTGDRNTGNQNTGDQNTGNWNIGNQNTGYCNIGNKNTGDQNTGNRNKGDWNAGDWNTGDGNTGDQNIGNRNTGKGNKGDWNTGMFNSCNYSNGLFNSKAPKIYMFNKPTRLTYEAFQKKYAEAYQLLYYLDLRLTEWINDYTMTDWEKELYSEYKTTGGYLKKNDFKKMWRKRWDSFNENEKELIKQLPNFDKDIFKEITGIEVKGI